MIGLSKQMLITIFVCIINLSNICCYDYNYDYDYEPETPKPFIIPADIHSLEFFGSRNQYLCHCTNGCDSSGNCNGTSNECDKGWFGLACQYQNLADSFISNIKPQDAKSLFTASVNGECKHKETLSSIEINWIMPLPFTWMTFKVKDTARFDTLRVSFIDAYGTTVQCINQTLIQLDESTFDLRCNLNTSMKTISIGGDIVKSVCYIRINGGRNLALLQNVTQSTQFQKHVAESAVDGQVKNSCLWNNCTHTEVYDTKPNWTIIFDQPYNIKRFVIYNRYDGAQDRLKKFDLMAYDRDGNILLNYQDKERVAQKMYTVLYPYIEPVNQVTVSQRHKYYNDKVPILTINEFEAYGECIAGTWGLECNNTCDTSCKYSCNKDDGSCNAVCIPNTNPPICLTGKLTEPHFSISSLVASIVVTCSAIILVIAIVWYVWRRTLRRISEIEIKYKDSLTSDHSTCIDEGYI